MDYNYYTSSLISIALSWLIAAPTIFGISIGFLFAPFHEDFKGFHKLIIIWALICVFLFSPARYIFFQIILALAYSAQSFTAFFTFALLSPFLFLIFGLLYLVAFALPLLSFFIAGERISPIRSLLWALIFPFTCLLGTYLFFLALPTTRISLSWTVPRDVIRATNGPAGFVFRYLVQPLGMVPIPTFYDRTPQTDIDLIRCHVASTYLTNDRLKYFLSKQYPNLFLERPE